MYSATNKASFPPTAVWLLAPSLLLGACGGGNSGGGTTTVPSAPVAITADNAASAAGASSGDVTATYDIGTLGTDLAVGVDDGARHRFRLVPFARAQLRWLEQGAPVAGRRARGATLSTTVACDANSGNVQVAIDDRDGSLALSNGDSITLSFSNCLDSTDQSVLNGGMTLTLGQLVGVPGTDPDWSATLTFTMDNLLLSDGSGNATINGDFTLAMAATGGTFFNGNISGNSLTIVENGITEELSNYDIAFSSDESTPAIAYTIDATGTLASTELGGAVRFQTLTTFSGIEPDYPHSGRMKISGAGNSSVTLTALDNSNVQLDIDVDGDGSSERTVSTQWSIIAP